VKNKYFINGLSGVLLALLSIPATAQVTPEWTAEKCRLYANAWDDAKKAYGTEQLGQAFLDRHDAFLASDCTGPHDVCPASDAETAMANTLTIMSMSEGMASTFVPFACPEGQ
jgi:hypothetical protein